MGPPSLFAKNGGDSLLVRGFQTLTTLVKLSSFRSLSLLNQVDSVRLGSWKAQDCCIYRWFGFCFHIVISKGDQTFWAALPGWTGRSLIGQNRSGNPSLLPRHVFIWLYNLLWIKSSSCFMYSNPVHHTELVSFSSPELPICRTSRTLWYCCIYCFNFNPTLFRCSFKTHFPHFTTKLFKNVIWPDFTESWELFVCPRLSSPYICSS